MNEIWWIRHGQSLANAGERTPNDQDNPLSPQGWQEAKKVAQTIPQAPSRVVVSPYVRTLQTAQPTLERFPHLQPTEWPIHEYTWLSAARRANSNKDERQLWANAFFAQNDPHAIDGEGAESFAQFMQRVQYTIAAMHRLPPGFSVFFGHAGFIKAMMMWLLSPDETINANTLQRFLSMEQAVAFPNTAILKLRLHEGHLWLSPPQTNHLSATPMLEVG